jgi:hypothetical protein
MNWRRAGGLAVVLLAFVGSVACGDDTGALRQEVAALKATVNAPPTPDARAAERDETIAEISAGAHGLVVVEATVTMIIECRASPCGNEKASEYLRVVLDACPGVVKTPPHLILWPQPHRDLQAMARQDCDTLRRYADGAHTAADWSLTGDLLAFRRSVAQRLALMTQVNDYSPGQLRREIESRQ